MGDERDITFDCSIENVCSRNYFEKTFRNPSCNTEYTLCLYPNDYSSNDVGDVSFRLEANKPEEEFCFEIILMNVDGGMIKSCYGKCPNDIWINKIIRNRDLNDALLKCRNGTLKVRLNIRYSTTETGVRKQAAKKFEAETEITEKYTFKWRVNIMTNYQCMKARRFFCLGCTPYELNFSTPKDDAVIKVCQMIKSSKNPREMSCKISLLDLNGTETLSRSATHSFDSSMGKDTWELSSLITMKQLLDKESEYMNDGKLVLQWEFFLCRRAAPTVEPNFNSDFFSKVRINEGLLGNYKNMLTKKTISDVKLLADDGSDFEAHKCVLATQSLVFAAMFDQEMLENRTGVVEIKDVEADILDSFLRFIYSGDMNSLDTDTALKLLLLADKYQVRTLVEECSLFLMSTVSSENVCDVLVHADMVNHDSLKKSCFDCLATHSAEVFQSPKWSQLVKDNAILCSEVFSYIGKNFEVTRRKVV